MPKLARLPHDEDAPHHGGAEIRRIPRFQHRYYAFLSYSHRNHEIADWLHRELEKFRVPHSLAGKLTVNGTVPKRLTPIFRDRQELAAAHDLTEEIQHALAWSQFLIVLCSPETARSHWSNAEIDIFKRTRPDTCVFAVIVDGHPFASDIPGREHEECFPPALRVKYDRRGRPTTKRAHPLAADLREEGDGRRMGFLKLVAGMLGVGLDDLVKRETTSRHRRMAWLAAASLGGMAVTSGLAIAAIEARDAARDQRREAEGLVEFMLGDLRSKLEPIGRLDALDGVGSRVLAYYKKQDTSELSDAALLQRSRALNLMAEVAYNRGNMAEADGLYRQAVAGTREAVRRSPDDPNRIFDLAQNVFWIAELARFRGDTDQAFAAYSEYKRLGDQLVSIQPDNLKWRMEALYGRENVGIALFNKRRFDEAARQFASAVGPMQRLAAVDPNSETYQTELSKIFAWLADAERARGNFASAIDARRKQVALLEGTIARSDDVDFRRQLITAYQGLGNLHINGGDFSAGIAQLEAAVREARQLMPIEPANKVWMGLAAGTEIDLAKAFLATGRVEEAQEHTRSGCELVAAIGGRNIVPSRLAGCLSMRSRLALRSGDAAQAAKLAQQALVGARSQNNEDPISTRYGVAAAYRLLGDARQRAGDLQGAKEAWFQALASLPQGNVEKPWEMDEHAALLERLGRKDEAQPRRRRLAEIGFHRVS